MLANMRLLFSQGDRQFKTCRSWKSEWSCGGRRM